MFYSLIKLRGAAEQQEFAFPFPYIKREDISVTVDGAAAPFTFTSSNTVSLAEPLPYAATVIIRRTTERGSLLVDYSQTAELSEEDLDLSARQFLYIAQEAFDTTQEAIVLDENGWDAHNNRIRNVGTPKAPEDAVNVAFMQEALEQNEGVLTNIAERAEHAAEEAQRGAARAQEEAAAARTHKEAAEDVLRETSQVLVDAMGVLVKTEDAMKASLGAVESAKEQAENARYWYDVFRSIYYGMRRDHPEGDVVPGAMYYNSAETRLYFFNGTQWYSPTTDAERTEAARRFVESMRNEVSNMRDQVQVYSAQAQELVGDAQDAANAAVRAEGAARNEAAAAKNSATAADASAVIAGERAAAADLSAQAADESAGRAEAAAAQVGETFGDRGGWYVAHGLPTKPMRSSLWTVMDGGELDGVEWNVGDMLVYSIKTNSFGRITGASITPSEPGPLEAEEGMILGDGKFIRARVGANIRWIAHANSEGVKLGDNAVELHLLGNNMVFGALKHPVFHKGALPSWDDVTGKPASFPASAHSHKWDEITGKPAAALRWPTWFEVTDKPTYFPPVTHGHSWNEITNKPDTALRWPTLAEVGAAPAGFGLGTEGKSLADKSCNDAMESGFYSIYSSTTDTPYGSGPSGSGMMVVRWGGGAGCFQLFFAYTAARVHVRRRYQDQWHDWFELYSTSKKPTAADVGARPANWVPSWDDVTGKPTDYPSAEHSHAWGEITGKPAAFPPATHGHAWGEVTGKPSTFPPAAHKHAWEELTGVPAQATRWPTFEEVTGKPTTYPAATHSHTWESVTGKPAAFPPATHSHAWGDVTGKPTTFPPAAHKHSWSELTNVPEYATRWPTAAEVGAAALNHGHARQYGSEQTLSIEDLDTIKTPGVYAQHANANTSAARHYPENLAGSLIVTVGAGVQQRYHVYNTSRVWTRAQYAKGAWTPWAREYNTLNKPTAADVGAIPVQGPGGVLEVGKYIDFHDAGSNVDYSLRLMQEGTSLRVQGANGYVDVGAKNTGYAHYYTDRPQHYFDKNVNVNDLYVRSDARLKSNFQPVVDALAKVKALKGWTYDKKLSLDSEGTYKRESGLIAQDVQAVFPSAVHVCEDVGGLLTLSSAALVALLVEAVKELSAKVEALEHGSS